MQVPGGPFLASGWSSPAPLPLYRNSSDLECTKLHTKDMAHPTTDSFPLRATGLKALRGVPTESLDLQAASGK